MTLPPSELRLGWAIVPNAGRPGLFRYRLWSPDVPIPDVRVSKGTGYRLLVAFAHTKSDAIQLLLRSAGAWLGLLVIFRHLGLAQYLGAFRSTFVRAKTTPFVVHYYSSVSYTHLRAH